MINHLRWHRLAALTAAVALALGVGASPAGGQASDERDARIAELEMLVADRDELIAAQESLLNDYRCRFDIDTQLVPNGCPEPARPAATPASDSQAGAPAVPAGTTKAQWEQLRQCNANGDYKYANPNGINFGAYQFRQTSWDDLARRHHPNLVGVVPSDAAPADQDRMAYAFYEERGWRPWPSCAASFLSPENTTPTNPTAFPPIPAGTTQAQWDQLIRCESGGNYRAYSSVGPFLGAFQFLQSTWDWVAGIHYPRLVGVDARDAAPADQHRMAYALYEMLGWGQWPTCTKAFRQ